MDDADGFLFALALGGLGAAVLLLCSAVRSL